MSRFWPTRFGTDEVLLTTFRRGIEMLGNVIDGHHVAEVDLDIEQVHLVKNFAALANSFAADDDTDTPGGVAAGGVDTMTGTDTGNDQRIHIEGAEIFKQVRTFER